MKRVLIAVLVLLLGWNIWLTHSLSKVNEELEKTSQSNKSITTITKTQSAFTDLVDSSQDKIVDVLYTLSASSSPGIYSGFVYKMDEEGNVYILTNENSALSAQDIQVSFANGISIPAEVCGVNHYYDLAVLRCKPDFEVPVFSLGKVDLVNEGEWLIAMGSSQQTLQSGPVAVGVLAGKYSTYSYSTATEEGETLEITIPVLQVNASMSRRLSGGPLMNESGEVIGMISSRITSGMNDTFTVALPIDELAAVAEQIIAEEEFRYLDLGYSFTQIQDLTSYQKSFYGIRLDQFTGLFITKIDSKNTLSAFFPIKEGDILTKINDQEVNTIREVRLILMNLDWSAPLTLTVMRPSAEYSELEFSAVISGD